MAYATHEYRVCLMRKRVRTMLTFDGIVKA